MKRYVDRDISWLAFNARVLQEASDPRVPLFERIRFMAIWSNNLDEFYRVRVAALSSIKRLGPDVRKAAGQPKRILREIRSIVRRQQEAFGALYRQEILPALAAAGIDLLRAEDINPQDEKYLIGIWNEHLKEHLDLQPITGSEEPPFLENRALYFLAASTGHDDLRLLRIPGGPQGRFVVIPAQDDRLRIVFIDDIVRHFIRKAWNSAAHVYAIKMSRDADLRIDDEYEGELVGKIRSALEHRHLGPPVRLLYDAGMPQAVLERMRGIFGLRRSEVVPGGRYHNFSDFFQFPFPADRPGMAYPPQPPVRHPAGDRLLEAVRESDILFQFPYQSFDHIPGLIDQAMASGRLRSIRMNIYRTTTDSVILTRLTEAARSGIEVVVFIEAKARFDEENNLHWGRRLEEAGVRVLYSVPGIKVHAKVLALGFDGDVRSPDMTLVSTGNFHEKSARVYTDYALLTADPAIAQDARMLFDLLERRILVPRPRRLLISPYGLRDELERLIQAEAERAREGKPASIFLKLNNLQDEALIDALYAAGQSGVQVRLLVRGICRLIPGKPGLSDRIEARSVVGRYLEHGRAFLFGADRMYIGSADWMTRNMDRRIEVLTPVTDPVLRADIQTDMETLWNDTARARILDEDLTNRYLADPPAPGMDGQSRRYAHFEKIAGSSPSDQGKSPILRP